MSNFKLYDFDLKKVKKVKLMKSEYYSRITGEGRKNIKDKIRDEYDTAILDSCCKKRRLRK